MFAWADQQRQEGWQGWCEFQDDNVDSFLKKNRDIPSWISCKMDPFRIFTHEKMYPLQ